MKKNSPLVSVVIPCYNYAEYVTDAIESVKLQTYSNTELIVIDDGSTDDTSEVLRRAAKKYKFKHVAQENIGIVKTRNKALQLVRGDYIIQLDADDTLDLNYVEDTLGLFDNKEIDIVYTNFRQFRKESANPFNISDFPEFSLEILKKDNFIHMASMLRLSTARKYRFDENLTKLSHEDWDFFLNMCLHGSKAALCKSTMLNYRQHHESRNNRLASDIDRISHAKMYSYIVGKYNNMFRDEYRYAQGNMFAEWYLELISSRDLLSEELKLIQGQLNLVGKQLDLVKSSRVWRARNVAAKLMGRRPI